TVTTRYADGRSRSVHAVQYNGSSQFVRDETITVAGDGSSVDNVSELNPDSSLKSKTVTSTRAHGLTMTKQSDPDGPVSGGSPVFYTTRTAVTVKNGDGSSTVTQTDRNTNNDLLDQVITTTSANGLSRTVTTDQDGNGVVDVTTTDVTVINGDNSLTRTV